MTSNVGKEKKWIAYMVAILAAVQPMLTSENDLADRNTRIRFFIRITIAVTTAVLLQFGKSEKKSEG